MDNMKLRLILMVFLITQLIGIVASFADEAKPQEIPDRYGMTMTVANTYDPDNDITFVQVSGFALFDHERIWPNRAPEGLRFKIEGSLGNLTRPEKRLIASANIFSLYYINKLTTKSFRPYVEGGIGIIYMDYTVEGQGLRFNFNPQIGIGAEIGGTRDDEKPFIVSLRLHHISNAGIDSENRGMNAVTLSFGRFF
jgi:lipid A 3-O-deacylase